ncbi:MAG: T9SS type A sorting domain-containing protein [Bacteroidota bacterium]
MKNIFTIISLVFLANNFYAQCVSEAHSNNKNDAWLSCEKRASPNPDRASSHWVLYDLGYVYSIGATKIWNYNVLGETDRGMKNIFIDYSVNGTSWNEATAFQLDEALGNNNYVGQDGPYLNQINARYILITAMDTWGNNGCAGLSEVRFDLEGTVAVESVFKERPAVKLFPIPASDQLNVNADFLIAEIIIVNASGHEIMRSKKIDKIDISYLNDGMYFLKIINENNEVTTERFVKQRL